MKRFLFLFTVLGLLFGCTSEEDEAVVTKAQIELTMPDDAQLVSSEGGTMTVELTSNVSWEAFTDQNWCRVVPAKGEPGTLFLQVSFDANEGYDERNATLLVSGGAVTEMITLTQKQKDALTVTSSKVELGNGEAVFDVEVRANVSFEYSIDESCQSWLKEVEADTRSLTSTTLHFKADANEEVGRREGKITIRSGDLSEVVSVYQEGEKPTLVLTQNEYVIPAEGETFCVELSSNVPYEIRMPEVDWITENKTRSLSTYTHYFTVAPNESYDSREAKIEFLNKENGITETISVSQVQKDAILLAKNEYVMPAEGGLLEFVVSTNVNFDIILPGSWIQRVQETRGLEDKVLRFQVEANPYFEVREGEIEIYHGGINQKVNIKQLPSVYLNLDKTDCVVECLGNAVEVNVDANIDYTISTSASWIQIEKQQGTPDIVTLNVEAIKTLQDANLGRSAEIVFSAVGQDLVRRLNVYQFGLDAVVSASSLGYDSHLCPDTLYIGYEKGNEDYRMYYSEQEPVVTKVTVDWLEAVVEPSTATMVLRTTKDNPTSQSRSGLVYVEQNESKQIIEVIQAPRPTKVGNYEAIDLGLSVKWALRNVGAASETDRGGLYGWADPTGLETTDGVYNDEGRWVSPLYGGPNPPSSICGTPLDIAAMKWGAGWRLPSYDEAEELWFNCGGDGMKRSNSPCQINWINRGGQEGIEFISYNGNRIFMPAAGHRHGEKIEEKAMGYTAAYYWTGTLLDSNNAYRLNCDAYWAIEPVPGDRHHFLDNMIGGFRYLGYSVRPVTE